jgi:hypothetical protein
MNRFKRIAELKGALQKVLANIRNISVFYNDFIKSRASLPSDKPYDLIIAAGRCTLEKLNEPLSSVLDRSGAAR